MDLLNLFFGYRPITKLGFDSEKYTMVEDGHVLAKQKFRDSLRSAWMQVTAIAYLQQNGFENLPEWYENVDFSLFSNKEILPPELLGGANLDLFDDTLFQIPIDASLGETLTPESISIKIEGLQVESSSINKLQQNAHSAGTETIDHSQGDQGEISFNIEEVIDLKGIDLAALEALLEAQRLAFLTKTLAPAVAIEDTVEIDASTPIVNGNLLSNDTSDPFVKGLSIVSVYNDITKVGTKLYNPSGDPFDENQGNSVSSLGTLTLNGSGNFTFETNLTPSSITQLNTDQSQSIPIALLILGPDFS